MLGAAKAATGHMTCRQTKGIFAFARRHRSSLRLCPLVDCVLYALCQKFCQNLEFFLRFEACVAGSALSELPRQLKRPTDPRNQFTTEYSLSQTLS